ncbi:MAG TPA: hypothetical protein VGK67_11130 [Myxococcales bacterium]|jgi:hypothetical protein
MRAGALNRWAWLGVSLSLAGCPFGTATLNSMPFLCTNTAECGPDQVCALEGEKFGHCLNMDGLACTRNAECAGQRCIEDKCLCGDGKADNGEADVDCGHTCADRCGDGAHCSVSDDCGSGYCNTQLEVPTCMQACTPDCLAKQCGNDGCGGECPNPCGPDDKCVDFTCLACPTSDCSGICDGNCRGACGRCSTGQYCDDGGSGCKANKLNGDSCKDNRECDSTMCLQGRCS